MSYKRQILMILFMLLAAVLLIAGCNMPIQSEPTQSGIDLISTYAAQTVQAQLTEVSKPPVVTTTPTPATTSSLPPGGTSSAQITTTPGSTQQATPGCYQAKFIQDVTIPDNTALKPGTSFKKTWRLRNDGTCSWSPQFDLVYFKGDKMGAPDAVPLTDQAVEPGKTIDVSVDMIAPGTAGEYRTEWKLRSISNEIFGMGSSGNPIWVQIQVITESGVDFISSAGSAAWRSGINDQGFEELAFGGALDNPRGVATIMDQVLLENGRTSGKVLLMRPADQGDSWITGIYPPYTIYKGNHFEARLGFMANSDGTCGNGEVIFLLRYREGEQINKLGEWSKTCNGSFLPVDIDISRLQGKTVEFILTVRSDGPSTDDWAIWNSPRITD